MEKRISLRKNAVSNSEKIKRQRFATEQIRAFAKQQKIELDEGVIAEAKRVKMALDSHNEGAMLLYVILSKDGSRFVCWDMIQKGDLESSRAVVRPHFEPFTIPADNVVEDFYVKQFMGRGLDPVVHMDYLFKMQSYYVLETLPMFEEQKRITELLEAFASEQELYLFDGVRAKIATYEGATVWSLRCSRDKKGRDVVYAIYVNGEAKIVNFCRAWVLQQRVAIRDIRRGLIEELGADAKTKKWVNSLEINPLLAECQGQKCWAWYFKEGDDFIICPIDGAKVYHAAYGSVAFLMSKEQQEKHISIDFETDNIKFRATCWYEFIVTEEAVEAE